MDFLLPTLGVGIVAFASTNIDDIFILSAFFMDRRLARSSIIIGQFVGMAILVGVSSAAALLALTIPSAWVALLGVIPLWMGIAKLRGLRHVSPQPTDDSDTCRLQEKTGQFEKKFHSPIFAVAAVTVANGSDNFAVYIPLFASSVKSIPIYALIFAVMTGLWCILGCALVNNRYLGRISRHYGHIALPFVLMGLGLYILSGTVPLIR